MCKHFFISILLLFHCININSQGFIDKTIESGILNNNDAQDFMLGSSLFDYNNDFLLDIAIGGFNGVKLFENNGNGEFKDISVVAGLFKPNYKVRAIATGDFNNDGNEDLIAINGSQGNIIFKNLGNNKFEEVFSLPSIDTTTQQAMSVTLGDINLDGLLDIYVAQFVISTNIVKDEYGNVLYFEKECAPDILYQNIGNFEFSIVNSEYNILNNGCAFGVTMSDPDNDSDIDILVTNDFGPQAGNDVLFQNAYPNIGYTNNSTTTGWDNSIYGMGLAVGDFDKDTDLDYYKTNLGKNVLLKNNYSQNGTLSFNNVANQFELEDEFSFDDYLISGFGTGFCDYDNDSKLDLIISNGHLGAFLQHGFESHDTTYSKIYKNNFPNPFTDVTFDLGFNDHEYSRGLSIGDIDNDGDQDFLITRSTKVNQHNSGLPLLMINEVLNQGNFLKVSLQGVVNNKSAYGAHLIIHTQLGSWIHEISGGGQGSQAQHSSIAHFGLGQLTLVDSLIIKWPGNLSSDQKFFNIPSNQHIIIKEGNLEYSEVTCYNGILDGDETDIDCGGSICKLCDCDKENIVVDYDHTFNNKINLHYKDSIIVKGDALITLNDTVGLYSGEAILLEGGSFNTANGEVRFEIEDCILMDLCYYSSLCELEHFEIDSLESYSIARVWNEVLLESIRNDFARPTIHARNLFHSSSLMYDIWNIYKGSENNNEYLINNDILCPLDTTGLNLKSEDIDIAISYGMAKLLMHRFGNSPSLGVTSQNILGLFNHFGYDINYNGTNVTSGNPADIGNYIAECYISFGLSDGANEVNDYSNIEYTTVNDPLITTEPGNPNLLNPNRWQKLTLETFIDQSGNTIPINTPDFLSPEWGNVHPFSLTVEDKTIQSRDGIDFNVYFDPSNPPLLDINNTSMTEEYKWGFMMVSIWSSHLESGDNTIIDISPGSIGNNQDVLPDNYYDLPDFYDFYNGGDFALGHSINPVSQLPYETQLVKRGDYARVLAEFWADGPDSETPPGHWFTILNYVSDNPSFEKRIEGQGPIVDNLTWDIISYFTLGGAMHDAAISAWSVKGYYDYIRPISAIRYMADQGQSSDPNLPNYSIQGMPLISGYSELVNINDPLVGDNQENLNKVKLYSWKGPDFINDPENDEAGVGWILAENWWPYQRPSFVTPPFAGYVSGHSTFSRAASIIMSSITGSEFFPDGMGSFIAKKNEFLVFEEGPSEDVILQWATYKDAADQCSLSRIWGGIHPPVDDIPGRIIGDQVGTSAYEKAKEIIGF